jgi:predicted dehydrogenase
MGLIEDVNWGIIGCGSVTELKSGPAFNKVAGSRLVAVMRRDGAKAQDYASRHGVPKWYNDATALIQDSEVNAVYVATPPDTHAMYAIQAMKAGKPVYVEKPMAATLQDCERMLEVSQETGVPLFVAYYRRTLPGFQKVKELVTNGTIGKPLLVNVKLMRPANEDEKENKAWRVQPQKAGGGIFYDLASHQLDFLDYLFGPIVEANGYASNQCGYYEAEDTVAASFKHASGVSGTGSWSFVSSLEARQDVIEIVGTEGRLEFSCFGHTPLRLYKDNVVSQIEFHVPENIQFYLIEQVVKAIRENQVCVSTGETAIRTNRLLEKLTANYYTRG